MNDEQIVDCIKNKNRYAFEELVNSYKMKIFSTAYRFTNDYAEAQDLAQEVFMKVYTKIDKFNNKSKLSTWIYKVAVNTCIDWKKKKNKNNFLPLSDMNENSGENIEEKLILKEKQKIVQNYINRLPDKYKTVIILYHFNNMSYKQISSILEIPEKTVETRLYRARKKIKEYMREFNSGGELYELQSN